MGHLPVKRPLYGGEGILEQTIEREWKSIRCPKEQDKRSVMIKWNIVSKKGCILKRSLREIDCHHPAWTTFGGGDCEWGCEGVIGRRER
jgi:hypothetical protein